MPVMQALAEVETCAMKCINERGFHQAPFIDRAARTVVRARRPFDHPVKDLELAELRLPLRNTFGAKIIHEGMLAGSCAYGEQGAQFFIEKIPFLFEAIESALGFFLGGLFGC